MYRDCAIFLSTLIFLISCGSPLKTRVDIGQPELDTAFYNKYIQKGPDTNMYPTYIFTSSQRLPVEKFGYAFIFDGLKDTWWSAAPGLNTGEYLEIIPGDIPARSFKVFIAQNPTMANVSSITVWINDSPAGHFPSGAPIQLPAGVERIRIQADEAGGLNEVKMELTNDTTGKIWVTKKNLVMRYNSKSFGISEVEFYDEKGVKLPVLGPHVKQASVTCHGIDNQNEKFYVFDNDPGTSAQWTNGDHTNEMILTFRDFVPFTKLRVQVGANRFLDYGETRKIGLQISGKKEQTFELKEGLNEIDLKEPYVARTYTIHLYEFENKNSGSINEIQGYDGARWYIIQPDSLFTRWENVKDSLANTPLFGLLNNQVQFIYNYSVAKKDTFKVVNKDIDQNMVEKRVFQNSSAMFKTNHTWEANTDVQTISYGKKVTLVNTKKWMSGDYTILSQSQDQVTLSVRCQVKEITSVDGKPGSPKTRIVKSKATITKTNLSIDGLLDMVISY